MIIECFLSRDLESEKDEPFVQLEIKGLTQGPLIGDKIDFSSWIDSEDDFDEEQLKLMEENGIVKERLWYRAGDEVYMQLFCTPVTPSSSEL